jgi:arylsulfatase A-like enzyme
MERRMLVMKIMDQKLPLYSKNSIVTRNSEKSSDSPLIFTKVWIQSLFFSLYYILVEWLFLISKPTFDLRVNFGDMIFFLLFALAIWTLVLSLIFVILFLIFEVIKCKKDGNLIYSFICLIPASIFTALFVMILDNFTYTVFHFGILTISPLVRILYLLFFILVCFFMFRSVRKKAFGITTSQVEMAKRWRFDKVILPFILLDIVVIGSQYTSFKLPLSRIKTQYLNFRPNIILITADGLDADHMSVYGYFRKTTPQIDKISKNSLVAMNAFTNASDSQGSVVSILTGKNPAKTRVLYSPDALMGIDAYDHLPGILHDTGYTTYQFGDPYFVDANTANMKEGFDYVNNIKSDDNFWELLIRHFPSHHQMFIRNIIDRFISRFKSMFWIEKIYNPGDILAGKPPKMSDKEKIEIIISVMKSSNSPVFIHLHMLGTHGPKFAITNPVFSKNQVSSGNWDVDYYDDSILQFDSYIGDLFQFTNDNNLSNTIFIIGSDHGQVWKSNGRIPLIIHFPNNSNTNKIYSNVQNIDIFPTILDYLGITNINTGSGNSLLDEIPEIRPIISLGVNTLSVTEQGRITFRPNNMKPPFFQFGYINLIYCDNWFKINLDDSTFESGQIENSLNSCHPSQQIDDKKAIEIMVDYLRNNGFKTSSLSEKLVIKQPNQD